MQNLENLDVFLNIYYTKTANMPEGPFCQIGAHLQCSHFITVCLESIGMDHVISEPCYKGTILQWNF